MKTYEIRDTANIWGLLNHAALLAQHIYGFTRRRPLKERRRRKKRRVRQKQLRRKADREYRDWGPCKRLFEHKRELRRMGFKGDIHSEEAIEFLKESVSCMVVKKHLHYVPIHPSPQEHQRRVGEPLGSEQ